MNSNTRGSVARHILTAILILAVAAGVCAGQKKKKSKDKNADNAPLMPAIPGAEENQINRDIGEMLGAFQIGDVEAMHKYYADNATFVSDIDQPPIMGWQNYEVAYQRQRAAFQGIQIVRRNTFVYTHGDVAWASYQWRFLGNAGGAPYSISGHTTLVFEKVAGNWLIVHNHTSQICPLENTAPPQNRIASTPAAPAQVQPPSTPR
ncbi:MAG TPA: nuclear transport factor 2 family protein [Candidatus Acidoferrales bacterium]|nr:nuclear transport factor 2 family protein [Candidatus Acidoferrales bacterium]